LCRSSKPTKGETINLATGQETTNLEMAQEITQITGNESNIVFVDYPKEFGNIKTQVGLFKNATIAD
jgi:nucleoside-diphosphate-sugar epimerase